MQLDIRLPMGLLFVVLGLILIIYGWQADPAIYARHSLGQNVNVGWGFGFVAFGASMLWLVHRARKLTRAAEPAAPRQ